ncbi:MAG TPA: class I SAM-dependent methyltransferase [Gemmatimonadaceae bacterium]|nr:class I SAM-dependent methyltransferase [Gemmatimonadaceae bacterium]
MSTPLALPAPEYIPFGNVEARNGIQASIEIPLLIRALRLYPTPRILEVGCGRGVALPVLAARLGPHELVGIDIDPKLVALANERVRFERVDATILEADVRNLPFDAGTFDLVIDFGTCYHVSGGMDGARKALKEIARVLSPRGLFVHETRIAQRLAHPIRSFGRKLPWNDVSELVPERKAGLWGARRKMTGTLS